MESLVFALFVNVVVMVWMSQGSYAGVSERWVCNRRVLMCGEQVPAGRFESAQGSEHTTLLGTVYWFVHLRGDRRIDSGRGRPLLHLN